MMCNSAFWMDHDRLAPSFIHFMSLTPDELRLPHRLLTAAAGWSGRRGAAAYQIQALIITWIVWVLGAMNVMLYSLVLIPALQELLSPDMPGASVTTSLVGWYGGIIFSIFLIGWAFGGVALGALADTISRTKVLMIAATLIAFSTGLAAFSQQWWHLACLRLLTGIGIGGLWAAGAALIAEIWADRDRARAAGFLQSAWGFGFFLAAAVTLALKDFGWRASFAIGLLTAGSTWLISRHLRDSSQWRQVHAGEQADTGRAASNVALLFQKGLRRSTWTGTGLAFVAVFGLWGATNWTPSLVQSLPELGAFDPPAMAARVSIAVMLLNAGALLGYFTFGILAERFGRKPVFAFMNAGSLAMMPLTFYFPHSYLTVLGLLPILGFFSKGVFGGFPLYLPELFPTRLRSTGAGFCYNAGRIVASVSPFITGTLVATFGSFGRAASAVAIVYVAGLLIIPLAPETKDRPLQD
ncbi:MFS transporter [Nitrospira sp. Nam80]